MEPEQATATAESVPAADGAAPDGGKAKINPKAAKKAERLAARAAVCVDISAWISCSWTRWFRFRRIF